MAAAWTRRFKSASTVSFATMQEGTAEGARPGGDGEDDVEVGGEYDQTRRRDNVDEQRVSKRKDGGGNDDDDDSSDSSDEESDAGSDEESGTEQQQQQQQQQQQKKKSGSESSRGKKKAATQERVSEIVSMDTADDEGLEDDVDEMEGKGSFGVLEDGKEGVGGSGVAPMPSEEKKTRIEELKQRCGAVVDYDYDEGRGEWATVDLALPADLPIYPFVTMLEARAPRIVVRQTPQIRRCVLGKSTEVSCNCLFWFVLVCFGLFWFCFGLFWFCFGLVLFCFVLCCFVLVGWFVCLESRLQACVVL